MFEGFPADRYILLDGAMGTMLQKRGLPPGSRPDVMNITAPESVFEVHRQYVEAGSDIIITNTFGSNSRALAGTGHAPADVIAAGVGIASRAARARSGVRVALDIGPIGEFMEPYGELTFDEAYKFFAEQARAGETAGADIVAVETMSDIAEVRAALRAIRENTGLPVFVMMTFNADGRTYAGCAPEDLALAAEEFGADAMGVNCSLGPDLAFPIVDRLAGLSDIPIVVKPNAGLPNIATGGYDMTPERFALEMKRFAGINVRALGGCCGTDPDFIKELGRVFGGMRPDADRRGGLV
jgi:5-methyltetrahydrofolate--homocysteine methyltransferase